MAAKKTQVRKQVTVTRFAEVTVTLMLLIAACAPLETPPAATQILPTPVVRVTHAATATTAPTPTPLATLAKIPIPKSDIAQLADDLYGSRVIEQISIPALNVDGRVVPVGWRVNFSDNFQSGEFEWDSPDSNVGWVITSALPDETGNVILYGHNNLYEKIFENLADLAQGDRVYLQTGNQRWEYKVRNVLLLPVIGASREQLNKYQKYLQPTQDARVTLISCWPPISNTHRVVVIGQRVSNP
ncbi:MAG: sortase [Anaerolineales bacterium]|nr:sortase [Anaerolineales bacterium]